jgi:uncharacterized protein YukE
MLVAKTFVPPEAYEIAAQFRQAASDMRALSGDLSSIGTTLDPEWDGHSKELFFDKFRPQPPAVTSLADWLMQCANTIEHIHVTIYVEVGGNGGGAW